MAWKQLSPRSESRDSQQRVYRYWDWQEEQLSQPLLNSVASKWVTWQNHFSPGQQQVQHGRCQAQ